MAPDIGCYIHRGIKQVFQEPFLGLKFAYTLIGYPTVSGSHRLPKMQKNTY